jgi:hypothetical protein
MMNSSISPSFKVEKLFFGWFETETGKKVSLIRCYHRWQKAKFFFEKGSVFSKNLLRNS